MKITCPHCKSDQLTHAARYIVRNPILKWDHDEKGNWEPVEFGPDEIVSDSSESVEFPFDCMNCGKDEMAEEDLLYDGQPHPLF